jgi:hypothetical protein
VYGGVLGAERFVVEKLGGFFSSFFEEETKVVEIPVTKVAVSEEVAPAVQVAEERVGSEKAVVVMPLPETVSEVEKAKQRIAENFSDEVKVTFDADGNSGVVEPIFKDKKGDAYLFVLVPVKK